MPHEAGPAFNGIGFALSRSFPTIAQARPFSATTHPAAYLPSPRNDVTPGYGSYNLNIESQVAKKVAVQIGYVGSQGRHLFHFRDLNQVNNVAGAT